MSDSTLEQEIEKGENLSVIEFVNALVMRGHVRRASDIHLDPHPEGVRVRMRIDGVLQDICDLPKKLHSEVVTRIKVLAGLRTDEHNIAHDGRFCVALDDVGSIDIRVSVAPTYYGENAVMRLLSDREADFTLETLGFSPKDQERIRHTIERPYGMILATGPTGSGKTTSLYTLIKMLNTPGISIITIEDPIEYSVTGINQIQVNPKSGLTFANGLRAMLRQDPNVIMVGEIRDAETAGIAVNTALTGHLLLSSLHTNDASTTLPRLLDLKIEPYLIASTVNVAIGQRLVRKICDNCKVEKKLTPIEAKSLNEALPDASVGKQTTFFVGHGCEACAHTGYRGRLGVYEVLVVDEPIREAILRKASANDIRKIAIAHGMTTMLADGFQKAHTGVTSISEVLRLLHE